MRNMTENKKRINVYIPMEMYVQITQSDKSLTDSIVEGLELVLTPKVEQVEPDHKQILNLQEARITELQDQLKVKDEQLSVKDTQIDKLSENMQAQAVHIQTLISQKAIEAPGVKKPFWKFW